MRGGCVIVFGALAVLAGRGRMEAQDTARRSARELGIVVGILPPGPRDAITDVAGVRVGHTTITDGATLNTGVTVILPHGGNVFREKVPGAVVIGNAFGKLMGSTQVQELGEIESPILLTCTLCVPRVADAALTYVLGLAGNETVRSVNVVVGETNDGSLNDIRRRAVSERDVLDAIAGADTGPVPQGSVGAGRGTVAFGWKGGIGSASRRLPPSLGSWTVGVLVQTNFGGVLTINGAPVGQELGQYYLKGEIGKLDGPGAGGAAGAADAAGSADGSIMIVVATDAPVDARNLERLGRRALAGLARTGSAMTNGSGDFVIAFSTVPVSALADRRPLANEAMSPLFEAAIEATEEAIYNSLFLATSVRGADRTVEALPIAATLDVLRRYGAVR